MVELIPAKCPSCGANLEFPSHMDIGHCMHCGSKIIIHRPQPDIHYHGVGSLNNYMKLGNKYLESILDLERNGVIQQKMVEMGNKKLLGILVVLFLLIGMPIVFASIHMIWGIICFFVMLVMIKYVFWEPMTKPIDRDNIDFNSSDVWLGASDSFWQKILKCEEYFSKAVEIDIENEEASEGHEIVVMLKQKYYQFLDPQQKILREMEQIKMNQQADNKKSGCFIATAAYGTPFADEVDVLRYCRDTQLNNKYIGRFLVNRYYQISPSIAYWIGLSNTRKAATRSFLKPIVWLCQLWKDKKQL